MNPRGSSLSPGVINEEPYLSSTAEAMFSKELSKRKRGSPAPVCVDSSSSEMPKYLVFSLYRSISWREHTAQER